MEKHVNLLWINIIIGFSGLYFNLPSYIHKIIIFICIAIFAVYTYYEFFEKLYDKPKNHTVKEN